jgi:Zn-dependent protease with chaperone function
VRVEGVWYSEQSNHKSAAHLTIGEGYDLVVADETFHFSQAEVEVSEAIASLPTRFQFANGALFIANTQIDVTHANKGWLYRIENAWRWIIVSTIGVLLALIVAYIYGIPWLSAGVVKVMSPSIKSELAELVLNQMEDDFEPSRLPLEQQVEIQERVEWYAKNLGFTHLPKVEFRYQEDYINAFALAGGTIVVLDGVVELAANKAELDSVLLHELGHVYYEHALRSVVEASISSVLLILVTGEGSGAVENLAAIAMLGAQLGHSREAELEADEFAKHAMVQFFGTPQSMVSMFEKLPHDDTVSDWLSTHPDMDRRIQLLKDELADKQLD